jgi:hypothetical protein
MRTKKAGSCRRLVHFLCRFAAAADVTSKREPAYPANHTTLEALDRAARIR